MADTTTTNYGLTKPEVGASEDTWGTKINTNLDTLDTTVDSIQGKSGAGVLKHTNNTKLATTSTGIDVTGNMISDGVGIGTSSPSYPFHLSSSGDTVAAVTAGAASVAALNLGNSTNLADGGIRYDNSANALILRASNTERMRIDASGRVGIGTTNPDTSLHVTTPSGTKTELNLAQTAVTNYRLSIPASTDALTFVYGASTERMRIDASGNVLVGKTAAGFANTGHELRGGGSYAAFTRDGGTPVLVNRKSSDGTLVEYMKDGTVVGSIGYGGGGILYNAASNYGLKFYDAGGANIIHPATTAGGDKDSSIDLGYSGARFKDLYLSGSVKVPAASKGIEYSSTAFITPENNVSGAEISTPGAFVVKTGSTPTERMRIDSSGNVGIGTSSPSEKLHVVGGNIKTDSSTRQIGYWEADAVHDGYFVPYNASGQSELVNSFTTGGLIFKTGTSKAERLRIDSSGNLLVGTTGSIYGTAGRGVLEVNGSSSAIAALKVNNAAAGYMYHSGTNMDVWNNLSGYLRFATSGAEAMRIDASGNLLVGTTSASTRLTVQGTGTGDIQTVLSGTTANTNVGMIVFRDGASDYCGQITSNGSTNTVSYVSASDQRLKENIEDADDAGSKIDAIQVRQYDWKKSNIHQDYGVIAQELAEVAPEAVHQPENSEEMMGVDYSKLVPMLIKEIQSLRNRVAQLEE